MKRYQLKIELVRVRPPVWRRVEVPGHISLRGLHDTIQYLFGWTDTHIHEFKIDGTAYGMPDPNFDQTDVVETTVSVEEAMPEEGSSFEYIYDFGDNWRHKISVEEIREEEEKRSPRCLDGKNAAPPEDVGGPPGYAEFLEAFNDPDHPEHERWSDWIGGEWDAEEFDLDLFNEILEDTRWENRLPVEEGEEGNYGIDGPMPGL